MSTTSEFPVWDGHNDTLLDLHLHERGGGRDFMVRSEHSHIDLPRALEGGFAGGFFAVFVPNLNEDDLAGVPPDERKPPEPLEQSYALGEVMTMTSRLFDIEARSEGQVKVVRTADEMATCLETGVIGAILHFEGAEAIDVDLNSLEVFYQAGLRSLGIVWSRDTDFGYGVPFAFGQSPDTGDGLTDAGKRLVKRCNELGIMIDLSHLNEKGFWDVAALSDAPLVATHSNVHTLCPTTRNLTDKQLDAIKESDGMVGLNFATGFLAEDGSWDEDLPLVVMVKHIDYLVERVGEDRVGFGSDFDGAQVSKYIGDVTGLPNLIQALRDAGYDDALLKKITHENWLRVLRKTWK